MKISIEIGNGVLLYRSSSVKCSHVIEKTEDRYISSLLFFPSSHLPLILQGKSSIMVHDNQHRLLFNEHSEKRDLGMLPPSPVTSCGVPIPTPHFHPKYATHEDNPSVPSLSNSIQKLHFHVSRTTRKTHPSHPIVNKAHHGLRGAESLLRCHLPEEV